jgi:hypothetical protein
VCVGALPQNLQYAAEMYAGCVSGAIQKEEYLQIRPGRRMGPKICPGYPVMEKQLG